MSKVDHGVTKIVQNPAAILRGYAMEGNSAPGFRSAEKH